MMLTRGIAWLRIKAVLWRIEAGDFPPEPNALRHPRGVLQTVLLRFLRRRSRCP